MGKFINKKSNLLLAAAFVLVSNVFSQSLVFNEFMSLNNNTIKDEDGDYPDWIEIYNRSNLSVDLSGFSLSDDLDSLDKWQFGAVDIQPDQFLLVHASGKDRQGEMTYWNNIIDWGEDWNFVIPDENTSSNWIELDYDDSGWLTGPTGIGYGDDDDHTIIEPAISLYTRKIFNVDNINEITDAVLHIDFDDSFVAYLNGVEIARENIGEPGVRPAYDQPADGDGFEALIYQGGFPRRYSIGDAESILNEGKNLLAVQVHNLGAGSSDMTFIPFLTLNHTTAGDYKNPSPLLNLPLSTIHTNFKLKSEGEVLILSDPDGMIIDSLYTGKLPADVSKGRKPDGSENWFYFSRPTPGSANTTPGTDSADVPVNLSFSHQGGFYDNEITLSLSADQNDVSIYYTTDGSIPDNNSLEYNGPIEIKSTTVIRAFAVDDLGYKSGITTGTYLINENESLPVISLSFDGNDFEFIYENNDAEVPAYIEMYETSGQLAFANNIGAEVFGGGSTQFEQKSLSIFFRSEYGPGELEYKLFSELPFTEYESFILRNSGNDWWSTMFRDAMFTNGVMKGTAVDYQEYRPANVYVNGEYWGIHNIREKVNEHFIKDHHYVNENNLDMLEYKEVVTPEIIHGSLNHYNELIDWLRNNSLTNKENYEYLKSVIDIDNFLDYQIAEIYSANIDWPANNNKFWRAKDNTGKWRWILYDTDTGFGLWDEWWADERGWELDHIEHALNDENSLEPGWPNPGWSTYIFRRLITNSKFKNKFINRFADYLNTRFSPETILQTISEFKSGIEEAIPAHLERWDRSLSDYENEVSRVEKFAEFRPEHVRDHLIDHFNLQQAVTITVNIIPEKSGRVKLNSLILDTSTWSGKYFTGAPVELIAEAVPGYRFKEWSGNYSSSEVSVKVNPSAGMIINCLFEPDSINGSLVINEINYNSRNDFDSGDWIEIYNNNSGSIDLSGWSIKDNNDDNVFIFPVGTVIGGDDYFVLCNDSSDFASIFPEYSETKFHFDLGLSSDGDEVRLFNSDERLIDSVSFSSAAPWPAEPDGKGPTLELINPVLDNSDPVNWSVSKILGTPGGINSGYQFYYEKTEEEENENKFTDSTDYGYVQNYPNPFSRTTKIRYRSIVNGFAELTIYNILGQKISTLIRRRIKEGEHEIEWKGRNDAGVEAAAGVYIYVYKVNNLILEIKKMLKL